MLNQVKKLRKLKLLFVDDEVEIVDIISDTLSKLDLEFHVCFNGKQAVEIINNNEIDLIVTDINMPEMDGIELIKYVKNKNSNINCIVMSAYTEKRYKEISKDLGVKEYITKPFDFKEFLELIDRLY